MTRFPIEILIAEDDDDDRLLTADALAANRLGNSVHFVQDGEELLDYLYQRGAYADKRAAPRPGLILLDLNMPKLDGREALAEIKADPKLAAIPVVVLTTSEAEEDIARSYDIGANGFISKPVTFEGLVEALHVTGRYWLEIVEAPSTDDRSADD